MGIHDIQHQPGTSRQQHVRSVLAGCLARLGNTSLLLAAVQLMEAARQGSCTSNSI